MPARSCKFNGSWLTHDGFLTNAPSQTSNALFSVWFKGHRPNAAFGTTFFHSGYGAQPDAYFGLSWHSLDAGSDSNNLYPMVRLGNLAGAFPDVIIPHDTVWHHLLVAMRISGTPALAGYFNDVAMSSPRITEVNPNPPNIINPRAYTTWCIGGDKTTSPTSHIGELTALSVGLEDEDYVALSADQDFRRLFNTGGWAANMGGSGFFPDSELKPLTVYASGNVVAFAQSLPQVARTTFSSTMSVKNTMWRFDGPNIITNGTSDPFVDG